MSKENNLYEKDQNNIFIPSEKGNYILLKEGILMFGYLFCMFQNIHTKEEIYGKLSFR